MKRDIKLIKSILMEIEKSQSPRDWLNINIEGKTSDQVAYHVKLLHDAGLIEAHDLSGSAEFMWKPSALTWHGHEFLDAIRNDTVWKKLNAKINEQSGNIPFHILKEMAALYVKELLI